VVKAGAGRPVALAARALGLGDFVTGLPALGLLKAALPDHEIVLAAPAVFAPLVPLIPAVDRLLPAAELAPISPVPDRLDVAIDLHGNGPASRRLLSALRPRRLFGFADPAGTLPGPTWLAAEHEVARWCRLVSEVLPVPDGESGVPQAVSDGPAHTRQAVPDGPANTRQAVPDGPANTRQAVPDGPANTRQAVHCMRLPDVVMPQVTVVHPGAAAPSRRWPAERFAAVATALRRQGHSVVVTGGPAERSLARTVADRAGVPALADLTLLELVSLIGRARLVVCGDTGVAHVASNYRTPSVLLFGPVSPANWGPPAGGPHRVLWHGDGTGDAHGQQADPALLAITVEEVLTAAEELVPSEAALPG
jgi:ADP-heptose:LPS heptosyltransferase